MQKVSLTSLREGLEADLKIDPNDAVPLYLQLAALLRQWIRACSLKAGDRLPTAHELSLMFKVNHNTVLRALRVLRSEGLVDFRRGRAVTVSELVKVAHNIEQLRLALATALADGFSRQQLISLLDEVAVSTAASTHKRERTDDGEHAKTAIKKKCQDHGE